MADWNEHVLKIRASLLKESKQEMLNAVREVFTDGAVIDFNNKENIQGLQELAEVMRKVLSMAGNTSIDFSKAMEKSGQDLLNILRSASEEFEKSLTSIFANRGSFGLKDMFMEDRSGISTALARITTKDGKIIKSAIKDIQRAFEPITTLDQNKLFGSLEAAEKSIGGARTWEAKTAAALEYVNIYERIIKLTDGNIDAIDVDDELVSFAEKTLSRKHKVAGLYSVDSLREAAPQMQTSLQNIFNMALGKPLIGLLEGGTVDLKFSPVVIKKLDLGDLFDKNVNGGVIGIPVVPEVDPKFKEKLKKLWENSKKLNIPGDEGQRANDEYYTIWDEIVEMFPDDIQEDIEKRLGKFLDVKSVADRSIKSVWKDFINYGMPVGDSEGGSYTGNGDGGFAGGISQTLDEKRNILERLQQKVQQSLDEQGTNMYRATQEQLDIAKAVLAEYEKIYVRTAGSKDLALGVNMSNDDLFKFLGMDAQKAKRIDFVNKEGASGSAIPTTSGDVEGARKANEFEERIEAAYKKLESFEIDPFNIKDEEEVNRLYQERLDIIKNIGEENLKLYDSQRYNGVDEINNQYANRLNSFKELKDDAIYKQLDEEFGYDNEIISESKDLELLLAKRRELMQQIYFDAEQEYDDEVKINQAIERRIELMKQLEPLMANGSITRDDYEDMLFEQGDLDERRQALDGVQQNLLNADPDTLDDAQYVLDQYEKILVETASGKKITLGPDMSNEDWKAFMRMDVEKAKSIEFVRKEITVHQENADTIRNEAKAQEELNKAKKADEARNLMEDVDFSQDDPYLGDIDETVNKLERIKTLLTEIGDVDDRLILDLDSLISDAEDIKSQREAVRRNYDNGEISYDDMSHNDDLVHLIGSYNESVKDFLSKIPSPYDYVDNYTPEPQDDNSIVSIEDTTGDAVVDDNVKKIQSYEELNAVVREYFDLRSKLKDELPYTGMREDAYIMSDRYLDIDDADKPKKIMEDFNALWSEREKAKKSLKSGETYISSDGNEYLGSQSHIDELTNEINGLAAAYVNLGGSIDDFSSKAKKATATDAFSLFKVAEEQDAKDALAAEKYNEPLKDRMNAIEASLTKQQINPDSIAVWEALELDRGKIEVLIDKIAKALGIEIPQVAQTAEQAIHDLNNNIKDTVNAGQGINSGVGTGDASSADVDAANAEAEKQRIEKERIEAEKLALQQENEAKLKAEADAKTKLQADLTAANQQLVDAQEAKALADANTRKAEDESRVKDGIIQGLREQLANVKSGEGGVKASIDAEALQNVLNAITYNVKVVQDADGADNKVSIDEASLKTVLNEVFDSVIKQKPQTQQNDGEQKDAPWAREDTLSGVIKETFAQIQANTVKIGTEPRQAVVSDVGNVLATESTLTAIKTAVEAINTKIVQETNVINSDNISPATKRKTSKKKNDGTINQGSAEGESGSHQKMLDYYYWLEEQVVQYKDNVIYVAELNKIIKQLTPRVIEFYRKLAENGQEDPAWLAPLNEKHALHMSKIRGGEEYSDSVSTEKKALEMLKEEYRLKTEIFNLEQKGATRNDLAPLKEKLGIYESIRSAIERSMSDDELTRYASQAASIQRKGEDKLTVAEIKARVKDTKKQTANDKQMAKKKAMVGKAGNAIGRAENVLLGAQDTDSPLPPKLNKQIDNLYEKLVALREKQNEVNQAPIAKEEQQKELRKQTIEVNSLTNEVGELLSEYQKLSGANVDPEKIRETTLTEKSGVDEYRQQMKQYVSEVTHGQGQIKNFDAATKTLTYTVKTGKNEFTEYTVAVRRADNAMVSVQGTTKRTETFFEATARKMKELTSYFSGMAIMSRAMQELRRGVQYVKEIDLALTELKKVTDETEETYDRFLQTAAKTGARLGTTISAVTEATATFAKLGYSMEQAAEMAEAALVYKNVGDNITSAEDAADSIISTLKGFKLEASDSMVIVDKFNEVGE